MSLSGVSKLRPAKPFHPALKNILSVTAKCYFHESFVDLVECSISRNNHNMQDVRPSKSKSVCGPLTITFTNPGLNQHKEQAPETGINVKTEHQPSMT